MSNRAKKSSLLLIAVAMLFVFAACEKKEEVNSTAPAAVSGQVGTLPGTGDVPNKPVESEKKPEKH